MKAVSVLFLLIPLIAADFDCMVSPYKLGVQCYYQYFKTVGNNFTCDTTYSTGGKNYLLSMEMMNIGVADMVTVSWDSTTVSNNGSSSLSIQQYVSNNVTIAISSGNSSQMAGIFFICPSDFQTPLPVTQKNVSYGQEAFILQQFTPTPIAPVNFNAPQKWEITADTQVALISAGDTTTQEMMCPSTSCMQLIWIYDGIGENARFIGTAADFRNKLYLSTNTTMTLYFVTMDMGSDYMAAIANEAKNLERCSSFDVAFYSTLNNEYKNTLNVTGADGSGACLTVLNHCYNLGLCDGVVVYNAINFGNSDFYVYAGAPHPDPINARLGIENYSQQNNGYIFPQNFAGNARTFYIANGSADLSFGNKGIINQKPFFNRWGFVMTNFYPLYSANMNGGSLDLDPATYSYNITLKLNTTYAPVGSDAYLEVDKNGIAQQRMAFDINTNVGTQFTVHVETGAYCRIFLWGGTLPNMGSYATYFIDLGEITTTTTTTPTPSTASTSPGATVTTTVTNPPTTTTPLPSTTTVASTTTIRPTDPTTTPKAATEVSFLTVTVFSLLLSLV